MRDSQPQELTLEMLKDRCTMDGDCWVYQTDAKTEHHRRYAQVKHKGERVVVRRLAYEFLKGPVKEGVRIVACCGNCYCVNPDHQKAMNESQKMQLAAKRGSFSSVTRAKKIADGRRKHFAKLTLEQAREIRQSSESGPVLSERYGINRSRVNAIKRGEAWKDYSNPFAGLIAANDAQRSKA